MKLPCATLVLSIIGALPADSAPGRNVRGKCIVPTGILDYNASYPDLPTDDSLFGRAIGTALTIRPGLPDYETPIQIRATMVSVAGVYGVASAFHPTALEMFGRPKTSGRRRRCQPEAVKDFTQDMFDNHRRVTLAYVTVWQLSEAIPQIRSALGELGSSWGLDAVTCAPNRQEASHDECDDLATPWGLARSIVIENTGIFAVDGWNADGSYSSTYNRVPFQDWRSAPYAPKRKEDCKDSTCWQPLLENDSVGFLYRQEHVTSHIGQTARSIFLGDDEVCSRTLEAPKYDYEAEAKMVLQRTAELDETTKAEVEFFDSKLDSLLPLQVQYYARRGVPTDAFEFIRADAAAIAALYESVIVAWKEKVRHDLVRPTTYIHDAYGSLSVASYLGPDVGTSGVLPANEWQPYTRVMPHAEYPSGSSCVCTAFKEVMERASGSDSLLDTLEAPLVFPVPSGSSNREVNQPSQVINFEFESWSAVADRCGASRLNGGMHFTASVPDGEDLCQGIGYMVSEYFADLEMGIVPVFTADVGKAVEEEVRCPPA